MIKKFLKVEERISWTKVGIVVCSIITALLSSDCIPASWIPLCKVLLSIGAGIGLVGARDAIHKQIKNNNDCISSPRR